MSMCNLTSLDSHVHGTLDHHVYHEPSHKWVRRRSKPQPFIRLTVETNREDYQQLGYGQKKTTTEAMADTRCQSCLTGTAILHRLGLPLDDLIPVTLSMRAANDSRLEILGAAILRLSDPMPQGKPSHHSIRQDQYLVTRRRRSSTRGTDTTRSRYTLTIVTSPCSSHHGESPRLHRLRRRVHKQIRWNRLPHQQQDEVHR